MQKAYKGKLKLLTPSQIDCSVRLLLFSDWLLTARRCLNPAPRKSHTIDVRSYLIVKKENQPYFCTTFDFSSFLEPTYQCRSFDSARLTSIKKNNPGNGQGFVCEQAAVRIPSQVRNKLLRYI